ncbi:MAG: hypothetical protein KKA67_10915 [Spirochaetes bacterium]|nr:hypothetical protein [Spirochaetota bacterium]MBU1079314.1 hypothetical protein [Spirochaetota bacterium]
MNRAGRRIRAVAGIAATIIAAAFTLAVSSCDVFGGLASPAASGAPFVRFLEPVNGEIDLSLYADAAGRSAYVVFTTGDSARIVPDAEAKALSSDDRSPPAAGRDLGEAATERIRAIPAMPAGTAASGTARSALFNSTGAPAGDYPGRTQSFMVVSNAAGTTLEAFPATCRYASGSAGSGDPMDAVDFGSGRSRTLSIWVADNCWDVAPTLKHAVTQEMVDALAAAFFGTSGAPSASIYAWVTSMLGDEWGSHGYSNLIAADGNVTILLADISKDNSDTGGIVGYFAPVNAVVGVTASNERVMFVIDAVMYANPDDEGDGVGASGYLADAWEQSDYWAETTFSTLAHEFQHMIHYYQKGVLRGGDYYNQPTWIDELCSMQVEDLLSDKMGVAGPRGVAPGDWTAGSPGNAAGRLPDFIYFNDISLDDWGGIDIYASYSAAYAFGAYLARNYGGAEFVRRVVQSADATPGAIAAAAAAFSGRDETAESLLRRWGAAVLLSGRTDAPEYYRYNTGARFASAGGGVEYSLGSIDMHNYRLGIDTNADGAVDSYVSEPYVYSAATIRRILGGAYSNAFMGLGDPASKPGWKLTVPAGMYATIVID